MDKEAYKSDIALDTSARMYLYISVLSSVSVSLGFFYARYSDAAFLKDITSENFTLIFFYFLALNFLSIFNFFIPYIFLHKIGIKNVIIRNEDRVRLILKQIFSRESSWLPLLFFGTIYWLLPYSVFISFTDLSDLAANIILLLYPVFYTYTGYFTFLSLVFFLKTLNKSKGE